TTTKDNTAPTMPTIRAIQKGPYRVCHVGFVWRVRCRRALHISDDDPDDCGKRGQKRGKKESPDDKRPGAHVRPATCGWLRQLRLPGGTRLDLLSLAKVRHCYSTPSALISSKMPGSIF